MPGHGGAKGRLRTELSKGVFPSLDEARETGLVRQWGADENVKEAGGGFPSATVSSAGSRWCPSPLCVGSSVCLTVALLSPKRCLSNVCHSYGPPPSPLKPVTANRDAEHCYILIRVQLTASMLLFTNSLPENKVGTTGIKQQRTWCACAGANANQSEPSFFLCYLFEHHLLQGWYFMWKFQVWFSLFFFCLSFSFTGVQRGWAAEGSESTAEQKLAVQRQTDSYTSLLCCW